MLRTPQPFEQPHVCTEDFHIDISRCHARVFLHPRRLRRSVSTVPFNSGVSARRQPDGTERHKRNTRRTYCVQAMPMSANEL